MSLVCQITAGGEPHPLAGELLPILRNSLSSDKALVEVPDARCQTQRLNSCLSRAVQETNTQNQCSGMRLVSELLLGRKSIGAQLAQAFRVLYNLLKGKGIAEKEYWASPLILGCCSIE